MADCAVLMLPRATTRNFHVMPRRLRHDRANHFYHAMNRAVRGTILFTTSADYSAFERVLYQSLQIVPVRLLAYCAMPNHWHMILSPIADLQLATFMHRFEGSHVKQWHKAHGTSGTGALYQGRYKAIEIRDERQFLNVCRYIERNPKKAGLVARAEAWQWASLWRRCNSCDKDLLYEWPIPQPAGWIELVNAD